MEGRKRGREGRRRKEEARKGERKEGGLEGEEGRKKCFFPPGLGGRGDPVAPIAVELWPSLL